MKKSLSIIALFVFTILLVAACSNSAETSETTHTTKTKEVVEDTQEVKTEDASDQIDLGAWNNLVGSWTIDAKTAGIQLDLTFNKDGSFVQKMGQINGEGTWEIMDAEYILVTTQNAKKGQRWKITDLTKDGVNICWNPESNKPKTLPMQRVN